MKSLRYYKLLVFALSISCTPLWAAGFGDIPASLALPAGTSVRRNALDTLFESFNAINVGGFTAHFSRGGSAIQTNDVIVTPWTCPYSGTITGYSISADTGTCTLKTWKRANGTAIPTIANVISTSGVSLSTGTHIRSSTVTDFTTINVTEGDMFMAQVTATSGATDITFQVEITR